MNGKAMVMTKTDTRTVLYNILKDMWNLAERHGTGKLENREWKKFVDEGETLLAKYRACDHDMELLFRDMFGALQAFYRRKGRGNGDREKQ